MPRRPTIARKTKYQGAPSTRLSSRFGTKLMTDGKRHLSERILREALARAEAQARRPGIEVLESAMRNATPIIEVKLPGPGRDPGRSPPFAGCPLACPGGP